MKTPIALYVHWPWCKAKCPYCDFNSHASEIHEDAYVDGVVRELTQWQAGRQWGDYMIAPFTPETHTLESVFFGGGTPSLMQASSIEKILDSCRKTGAFSDSTEVTVECNPTSFDELRHPRDFFEALRRAGVNRVSVGVQALEQQRLGFLGRHHSVEGALATLDAAQAVFDSVNADVIYGLPEQTPTEWEKQLKNLSERGLTHISAYQLTIERNTAFYGAVKRGLWTPISSDAEADFFDATRALLGEAGYENYEISNFAKPGFACRHNVHVWNYQTYLGIGAGAHGRVFTTEGRAIATQVTRQPDAYLRKLSHLDETLSSVRLLSNAETAQEAIFSSLRLKTGLDMDRLSKRIRSEDLHDAISDRETDALIDAGFLERRESMLRLTEYGWARLNSILNRILKPIEDASIDLLSPSLPQNYAYSTVPTVVIE